MTEIDDENRFGYNPYREREPITPVQVKILRDLAMVQIRAMSSEQANTMIEKAIEGKIDVMCFLAKSFDPKTLFDNR